MGTRVPKDREASLRHIDRLSDFNLLQRLRKRDLASLRELHRRHAGFVNAIALRVLGRAEEAEEVVQEVFIHLWTHGFELDEQRARFLSWLFVVARNRAIDRRRLMTRDDPPPSRSDGPVRSFLDESLAEKPDGGDAALRQAERVRVNAGVAALSEPERAIIELAFYDGYTHTEIAGDLDRPLEEVKDRLRIATDNLHRILSGGSVAAQVSPGNSTGDSSEDRRSGEEASPAEDPGSDAIDAIDAKGASPESSRLEKMAPAFALGALDGEERSAFEARLFLGDGALWLRVRALASTTDGLISRIGSWDLPSAALSQLEERMIAEGYLSAHSDEDFDSGLSWRRRFVVISVVLGAALWAGMTLWLDSERRTLQSDLAVSEQGRAELGMELADQKEKFSQAEFEKRQVEVNLGSRVDALASVMRPSGRVFRLRSAARGQDVASRVFVDTETKRLWVSIDALPTLPPEQTYQLWVFVDDEPIDGVVFIPEESPQGNAIQLEAIGPADGAGTLRVAVTIEPAGGSPLPAGPIILSGS